MSSFMPGCTEAAVRSGMAAAVAHQRKAARQHAAIGERGQQLSGALQPRGAVVEQRPDRALGALGQGR